MPSIFDDPRFNGRLFFPQRVESRCPPDAVDLRVSAKGTTLHLRWHHAVPDAPTVLLFHGNGETVADYDLAAPAYARHGMNLAVVDYRGYGRSDGAPSLRAILDDAPAALAALREAATGSVFVMGRSLGSLCAATLYARNDPTVAGFIYESGITDLAALLRRRGFPAPPRFTAAERARFDPRGMLPKGTRPMLVLHATGDEIIPVDEARAAFALAGTADKTLTLIPDEGHNTISCDAAYWSALGRFVHARG
ncbi:MAG: alpha/beta fold hydrolase [Polyangiales bacterium]